MAGWLRRLGAAFTLGLLTSLLLVPLVRDGGPRPRACHCPVPMECCANGTCHMDDGPPEGPAWKSCSGDGAGAPAAPPPSHEAPLPSSAGASSRPVQRAETPPPPVLLPTAPAEPATPPPEGGASTRHAS